MNASLPLLLQMVLHSAKWVTMSSWNERSCLPDCLIERVRAKEHIGFMFIQLQSETVKLADGAGNFAMHTWKSCRSLDEKKMVLKAKTKINAALRRTTIYSHSFFVICVHEVMWFCFCTASKTTYIVHRTRIHRWKNDTKRCSPDHMLSVCVCVCMFCVYKFYLLHVWFKIYGLDLVFGAMVSCAELHIL